MMQPSPTNARLSIRHVLNKQLGPVAEQRSGQPNAPRAPQAAGSRHTDCRVVPNHRAARRTILVELHLDAAHARPSAQLLCARAERVRRTWSRPGCASRHQRGCSWCRLRGGAGIEPASLRCDRGGGRCTRTSQNAAVAHGGAVLDVHPAHHRRGGRDEGVDRRVRGLVEHRQQRPVPVVCRANAVGGHGAAAGRARAGLPAGGTGDAGGARHAQYPNSSGCVTSVSSYSSSTHGSGSTFVARLRHAAARGAARGGSRGSARPWAHNRGHASVRGRTRSAALGASGACHRGECR